MNSETATASVRPKSWDTSVRLLRQAAGAEFVRVLALVALYSFAAYLRVRHVSMLDPDIWWHIRIGDWILTHHHILHNDHFSQYGMGKPWAAYSWLFEVLFSKLYAHFQLVGIFAYELAMRVAITLAVHHLIYGILRRFWTSAALTAIAVYGMLEVLGPRPVLISVVFTAVTLDVLLRAVRKRQYRLLWLLPPIFCLWANTHIQFVYGLAIVALFTFEPAADALVLRRGWNEAIGRIRPMLPAFFVTLASTLINPYTIGLYAVVLDYARQTKLYDMDTELFAPNFRSPEQWAALFLVVGAGVAIGYRKRFPIALTVLFLIAVVCGFRAIRDAWFMTIVSAVVIAGGEPLADKAPETNAPAKKIRWQQAVTVTLGIAATLMIAARYYDLTNDWLDLSVQTTFPVAASQYIESHHLRGPIFNDFNWGGYLIWRLPEYPVAIDGRTNIHKQDRMERLGKVWGAKGDWSKDPDLLQANVILANQQASLTRALRCDPDYRAVYEDSLAAVFVRSH